MGYMPETIPFGQFTLHLTRKDDPEKGRPVYHIDIQFPAYRGHTKEKARALLNDLLTSLEGNYENCTDQLPLQQDEDQPCIQSRVMPKDGKGSLKRLVSDVQSRLEFLEHDSLSDAIKPMERAIDKALSARPERMGLRTIPGRTRE